MKKYALIILFFATSAYRTYADINKVQPFHEEISKLGAECYLVCVYDSMVNPHNIPHLAASGNYQITIKATIVKVVRGKKKIGNKIEFIRFSGTKEEADKAAETSDGKLKFIFRQVAPDGTLFIDSQNPDSIWPFSDENEKALLELFHQ